MARSRITPRAVSTRGPVGRGPAERLPRIAVERLEKILAKRADIADASAMFCAELPLELQAELIGRCGARKSSPTTVRVSVFGSVPAGTPGGVDCSSEKAFGRLLRLIAATYGNELTMLSAMFRNA